jgi:hypothetical protein
LRNGAENRRGSQATNPLTLTSIKTR